MFAWLCGDHIVEQHIHNLDVANWIKNGYPVEVPTDSADAVSRRGVDSGEIFRPSRRRLRIRRRHAALQPVQPVPRRLEQRLRAYCIGTKGTCDVSGHTIRGENAWRRRGPQGESNDGWQLEHFPLQAAIRGDKEHNEGERGALSTLTAIVGRLATYSGKVIEFDEALNSNISLMPDSFTMDAMPKVLPGPDGLYPYAIPGKTVVI